MVGGGGMFVDDVVKDGTTESDAIEDASHAGQVFADLDTGDGGIDGVIVGTRLLGLGVTAFLGVKGIHLGGPAPEPKENAVLRLALEVKLRGPR